MLVSIVGHAFVSFDLFHGGLRRWTLFNDYARNARCVCIFFFENEYSEGGRVNLCDLECTGYEGTQVHWHARAKVGKSNLNQRRRERKREKSGVLGHRSASIRDACSCLCSLNPVLETSIPSQIFKLLFTRDFRGVSLRPVSNYIFYSHKQPCWLVLSMK